LERTLKYILRAFFILFVYSAVFGTRGNGISPGTLPMVRPDTTPEGDTNKPANTQLQYPLKPEDPIFTGFNTPNALYLNNPENIKQEIEYDPETNRYYFVEKIGDQSIRTPNYMTFEEYLKYDLRNSLNNYWEQRSSAVGMDKRNPLIPQLKVGGEVFDKIFGGNTVDIRPQGSAELTFGVLSNRRDDPSMDIRQRRQTNFDFKEKIQMSVIAKIGDKIEFKTNYNTEATFEFENKLKLKYEGKEDEILKLLEAGDVTLPLNSTLITGSQSLFGIKTKLQFGKTMVTGVFSQQKSESKTITVEGGAQKNTFKLNADQYD